MQSSPSIFPIEGELLKDYLDMTFPFYRKEVMSDGALRERIIAIGTNQAENPVGLILAEREPQTKKVKLLSLYVDLPYRNRGLGTSLLLALTEELKRQKYVQIYTSYTSQLEETGAFERLLLRHQWRIVPDRKMVLISCSNIGKFVEEKHLIMPETSPYFYSLFSEIDPEDKNWILSTLDRVPAFCNPFSPDKYPVEALNSLILKENGKIQGWLITHRIDEHTIRYTQWFVFNEKRHSLATGFLLAEALRRHAAVATPDSRAIWGMSLENTPPCFFKFFKEEIKISNFAKKDL